MQWFRTPHEFPSVSHRSMLVALNSVKFILLSLITVLVMIRIAIPVIRRTPSLGKQILVLLSIGFKCSMTRFIAQFIPRIYSFYSYSYYRRSHFKLHLPYCWHFRLLSFIFIFPDDLLRWFSFFRWSSHFRFLNFLGRTNVDFLPSACMTDLIALMELNELQLWVLWTIFSV